MALLPECAAERYAAPGVRFVPLAGDRPAFATAIVTRRETAHMPTVAFLRAVSYVNRTPAVRVSLFGSQLLLSQFRCTVCGSYFEGLREDRGETEPAAQAGGGTDDGSRAEH